MANHNPYSEPVSAGNPLADMARTESQMEHAHYSTETGADPATEGMGSMPGRMPGCDPGGHAGGPMGGHAGKADSDEDDQC